MMRRFFWKATGLAVVLLMVSMGTVLNGQVLINEICASNSQVISDPDHGEYADWIELYNADNVTWNLKGFYLTDNLGNPEKWQISTDLIINPGEFAIVWADGLDSANHASFKLSAVSEEVGLYNANLTRIDSLVFGLQSRDISYGRSPDGSSNWAFYSTPTPGTANTTTAFSDIVYDVPTFSMRGGFYNGTQTVEISSQFGGTVRYTRDGSEPDGSSSIASGPITVSATTILRARVFRTGMIPGPIKTHSYFIDVNSIDEALPVVSIASDPYNFWDADSGIYVQSFKPEWEVPVNVELFENNGMDRAGFNVQAGVKVNGLYSWRLPEKMLGVYFRKAYGEGSLDYTLLEQNNRSSYKSFALRASGSDWSYTLFRDILGHHAILDETDVDIMGFKPAIVYINGVYMGIHNIREKVDDDYIEKNHGLDPGTFDLVENLDYAEAGDLEAVNEFLALVKADLSVQSSYDAVAALIDVDNYTDMAITEVWTRNISVDHNVMCYKPKEGGKWKWIMMDLDRGFLTPSDYMLDYFFGESALLLDDMFENDGYREYFFNRLAGRLFTTFNAARITALVDEHIGLIDQEIPRHIDRWEGTTSSYGNAIPSVADWYTYARDLKLFANERPATLMTDLVNYDMPEITSLTLATEPSEAGIISIDGFETSLPVTTGYWFKERSFNLSAGDKPGYDFSGWYRVSPNWIVKKGDTWKYFDQGNPGTGWNQAGFSDDAWKSGPAQLGYGDGDEATVIAMGPIGETRNITNYFRKSITLTAEMADKGVFVFSLLRDDGAIVYVNGTEVIRNNMSYDYTGDGTGAKETIDYENENIYFTYIIDKSYFKEGSNTVAVEVHQKSYTSSDVSFDLGIACYLPGSGSLVSASPEISYSISDNTYLEARYNSDGSCMIPSYIESDMTLSVECSPYYATGDITIPAGVILDIDAGVEIRLPQDANIYISGELNANGTGSEDILFTTAPGSTQWGGMVFRNTSTPSTLVYVTIENASEGPVPIIENAAISAMNADLVLDHLVITQTFGNPIMARYSDVVLTNSELHSEVTGDLINVKYGTARIENCKFTGNNMPDTDAIDYDEVIGGVIRNVSINGFYGFNSDAVDIGEEAEDVTIDSIVVYNITDKGISLGQLSTATVSNSIFINCNLGVAVKDSSTAIINNSVFYNNVYPVACYEKNVGLAGGNASVRNSILSNYAESIYLQDERSTIRFSHTLADGNDSIPGNENLLGDPLFREPSYFDFELNSSSPAILSGIDSNGNPVNIGTQLSIADFEPTIMITEFFVNAPDGLLPEYIKVYNPTDKTVNASGYYIDKGITATIPEGTIINPGRHLYLTSDASDYLWDGVIVPVIQWEDGHLSNNGEAIRLLDDHGIVLDHFRYDINGDWPAEGFGIDRAFVLRDLSLDNHFGKNWSSEILSNLVGDLPVKVKGEGMKVYPNPGNGIITIECSDQTVNQVRVFDIRGALLTTIQLDYSGTAHPDLSSLGNGMYILKAGDNVEKIIIR